MDAGALGRGGSVTKGDTDLKTVRHGEWDVIVRFMTLLFARNSATLAEG